MMLDIKKIFYTRFNFVLAVEILMRPTLNTYRTIDLFLRKSASVATKRLRIFTHLLPIVVGVAVDVLGNRKVQLFHHNNTGEFLLCP